MTCRSLPILILYTLLLDNIFGVGILQILSDEVENPLSHYPEVDAVYIAVTLNMGY